MGTDQLYFPYPINVDHELVENLKVLNAFGRYCGLSGNNFIARVFFVHIQNSRSPECENSYFSFCSVISKSTSKG